MLSEQNIARTANTVSGISCFASTLKKLFCCTFTQTSASSTSKAGKLISSTPSSVRESFLKFVSVSEVSSGRYFTHDDFVSKPFSQEKYCWSKRKIFFSLWLFVAVLQKGEEAFRSLITCSSKCSHNTPYYGCRFCPSSWVFACTFGIRKSFQ